MLEAIVASGADELGVTLPDGAAGKLAVHARLMLERNREFNLTAIKEEDEAARLHYLDCLALTLFSELEGKRVLDVGSGAGFPGLVIAAAVPSSKVTLLDSTEKKTGFLKEAALAMGVDAVAVAGRAEELARTVEYRERFDVVTSRAVARLNVLAELCIPFVAPGGVFLAMKSAASEDETMEAVNAIRVLGGEIERVGEYTVPGTDIVRHVVVVRKLSATPPEYPRRYGTLSKRPL